MSSYRRLKHVYNDNWEDPHPFTDTSLVTSGEQDSLVITLQEDFEECPTEGGTLSIAAFLDRI